MNSEFGISDFELPGEEIYRLLQPIRERHCGLPSEDFLGEADVGLAHLGVVHRQLLVDEIVDQIHLNTDNSLPVASLREICGQDTGPLESVLEDYLNKKTEVVRSRQEVLQKDIADRYHISGSAVAPNLETDSDRAEAMKAFESNYQEKFEAEKTNYK